MKQTEHNKHKHSLSFLSRGAVFICWCTGVLSTLPTGLLPTGLLLLLLLLLGKALEHLLLHVLESFRVVLLHVPGGLSNPRPEVSTHTVKVRFTEGLH